MTKKKEQKEDMREFLEKVLELDREDFLVIKGVVIGIDASKTKQESEVTK